MRANKFFFNNSTLRANNYSNVVKFYSHAVNMSGIQKVHSIEESKGRDVESCCPDQNEKTLAFF